MNLSVEDVHFATAGAFLTFVGRKLRTLSLGLRSANQSCPTHIPNVLFSLGLAAAPMLRSLTFIVYGADNSNTEWVRMVLDGAKDVYLREITFKGDDIQEGLSPRAELGKPGDLETYEREPARGLGRIPPQPHVHPPAHSVQGRTCRPAAVPARCGADHTAIPRQRRGEKFDGASWLEC
ncbi:hypothetical protein BD413DRAFT_76536 [Trametes elegans]|nr:hypothetical protein BD413DRAFT_76536 [Trametes elegans]